MQLRPYLIVLLCLLAASSMASAAMIDIGTHIVPINTETSFEIYVTGGEQVGATNVRIEIVDSNSLGSPPIITDLDILTGTIFENDNDGQVDVDGEGDDDLAPQFEVRGTDATGTVAADGLLATVTVDTTGATIGDYDIIMEDTVGGAGGSTTFTNGGEFVPTIISGTLTVIVPEPGSLLLLFAAAPLVMSRSRSRV